MKIIGLTGGIGAGKSTVANYLLEKGLAILDADRIAREIVEPGSGILLELTEFFGKDILLSDGSLDRKKLGSLVFSDGEKKLLLDGLMHRNILEVIENRLAEWRAQGREVAVIDAPLLFETGLDASADETWLVDADDEARIRRIMARDGLSEEEIGQRIAVQMSREEKRNRADEILDNSGNLEALYEQVEQLLQKLQSQEND